MPIAAIAIPAAIAAGGAVYSGVKGASAAKAAAATQSNAAQAASDSIMDATRTAQAGVTDATTAAQTGVNTAVTGAQAGMNQAVTQGNQAYQNYWDQAQGQLNPYLTLGQTAATNMNAALQPGGALSQQFSFNPQDFQGDPGYQWMIEQGQKALERSAAARGGAFGGGAGKALSRYITGAASTEFNNAYNRALSTFQTNRNNTLTGLQAALGYGQNAVNQFNQAGQFYTGGTNANLLHGAQYVGDARLQGAQYTGNVGMQGALARGQIGMQGQGMSNDYWLQGANAKAAGQVGSGNAWGNMATQLANIGGQVFAPKPANNNFANWYNNQGVQAPSVPALSQVPYYAPQVPNLTLPPGLPGPVVP